MSIVPQNQQDEELFNTISSFNGVSDPFCRNNIYDVM